MQKKFKKLKKINFFHIGESYFFRLFFFGFFGNNMDFDQNMRKTNTTEASMHKKDKKFTEIMRGLCIFGGYLPKYGVICHDELFQYG